MHHIEERRKGIRRHLLIYFSAFDKLSGKMLGRVGDISTEGLLLLSEEELTVRGNMEITIQLPKDRALGFNHLDLEITPLWEKKQAGRNFSLYGCAINTEDMAVQSLIEQLVREYSFSDGYRKVIVRSSRLVYEDVSCLSCG